MFYTHSHLRPGLRSCFLLEISDWTFTLIIIIIIIINRSLFIFILELHRFVSVW